MPVALQAVPNQEKTEVVVAAKATQATRQSGKLGIGKILGSKEGSAIMSVAVGAAIAAASSSPAGLFAAATVYVLTENFRLSIKKSIAFKAADVAIADRKKMKLELESKASLAGKVPALEEQVQKLTQDKGTLSKRNEELFQKNQNLEARLQAYACGGSQPAFE